MPASSTQAQLLTRHDKLVALHQYVAGHITYLVKGKRRADIIYLLQHIELADVISQCYMRCLEYEDRLDFAGPWKGYAVCVVSSQLENLKKKHIGTPEFEIWRDKYTNYLFGEGEPQ